MLMRSRMSPPPRARRLLFGLGSDRSTFSLSHCAQVLKIAILAERDAADYSFYVDVILNLIRVAGDYVSTEVCERGVHRLDCGSSPSAWL